jgi:TPR repeat protein
MNRRGLLRLTLLGGALALTGCATDRATSADVPFESLASWPLRTIRREAEAGHLAARVELARRYGTGTGVRQDEKKAAQILIAASEAGDRWAQYYLGTAYEFGAGVKQDEAMAAFCFDAAAKQGLRDAQYKLALMIIEGRGGIFPSWERAIPFLEKAAEQDLVRAQYLLANALATGTGGRKDSELAATWYRRSIKLAPDNQPSVDRLILLIRRGDVKWQPGDPEEARPASTAGSS